MLFIAPFETLTLVQLRLNRVRGSLLSWRARYLHKACRPRIEVRDSRDDVTNYQELVECIHFRSNKVKNLFTDEVF